MNINNTKTEMIKKLYMAELPPRACSVYLYLFQRCYNKESCFPAIKTIANDMNLSRSMVKRALTDLESSGFIIKQRRYRQNGGNSSNEYVLGEVCE